MVVSDKFPQRNQQKRRTSKLAARPKTSFPTWLPCNAASVERMYKRSLGFLCVVVGLLCFGMAVLARPGGRQAPGSEWRYYGGNPGGQRFSPLDQINRNNVSKLRQAWVYNIGDVSDGSVYKTLSCFESTPLVVDGILYVTTPFCRLVALDCETGRELWSYDPKIDKTRGRNLLVNRGAAYWTDGKDHRVFYGTLEGKLICLKARSGELCSDFGDGGVLDLHKMYAPKYPRATYEITSAPTIYKDLVIPSIVVEAKVGPDPAIRAFDVRTARQVWQFDTIPKPGQFGHDTWEEGSWVERSGANTWITGSVDVDRKMVFFAIGAAAYDYFGGDRKGQNLFANSVVALNAETGERIRHFQAVHHDLWDYDLPAQPNLVTVVHDGRKIDAVAKVTKMGYVFVLDRETGRPLFPVEGRPVPRSELPEEEAWPTQPFPLKPPPIARQTIREDELSRVSPESYQKAKHWFRRVKPVPLYTPSGLTPQLFFPGLNGAVTWPGASFDPTSGFLYVSVTNLGTVIRMKKMPEGSALPYLAEFPSWGETTQPFFMDGEKFWPLQKPPWGTLVSVDLNKGEIVWEKPLGIVEELIAAGVPPTGTINFGGTIVTAGGLVFVGGTTDSKFRAFDKQTGEVLWETKLEAPAFATPMTYFGPRSGKQFVVVAAGGGNKYTKKFGDALVVFSLP